MKKKKLLNICDFENRIMSNQLKPYCNVEMEASLSNNVLKIDLNESIKDVKECYIVAYDKKEQKCLALDKVLDVCKNKLKVSFSGQFIGQLNSMCDFRYARLCIAVSWEEKYAFFYLSKVVDDKAYKEQYYYIGNVAEWMSEEKHMGMSLYYSGAGLLSIKPMEMIYYPKKYIVNMLNESMSSEDCERKFALQEECDDKEQLYKRYVEVKCEKAKVWIENGNLKLHIPYCICIQNDKGLKIDKMELVVDDNHKYPLNVTFLKTEEMQIFKEKISLNSIVEKETAINNAIHFAVWIEGVCCRYNIGKKTDDRIKTKYYYVPTCRAYVGNYAVFIRRNLYQNYVMVVRRKEPEEKCFAFRLYENKCCSFLLYHLGKMAKKIHKKNVNLFFEKNSMKAEEGAFEVFKSALGCDSSKNYFILSKQSKQWKEMSKYTNVIGKYSFKYYRLLYKANNLISTEMSSHLNIHRSTNPYIRRALLDAKLIFLQHGVTYMKCHGKHSVFGKGKEGEPDYIIVGSDKEKKVVCEMLKIEGNRCLKTGLPVFDTMEYKHISQESDDIVTIMLTWKPSEEHLLSHFETSTCYRNTKKIYDALCCLLSKSNIRIVPHPKVLEQFNATELKENIWGGTISEVLNETKLLITDYSSVCYNSFYQGGAVLFYQADLETYESETGKLIPSEDEYIGMRFHDLNSLKEALNMGIHDNVINLNYYRTSEYENAYKEINEFNDGKNVERIIHNLKTKQII